MDCSIVIKFTYHNTYSFKVYNSVGWVFCLFVFWYLHKVV